MADIRWSHSEKRIARHVYEGALERELDGVVREFKTRAASIASPAEMWDLGPFLADRRREIDAKFDFRYSQLCTVFGWLLREGRIEERDLQGLGDEKLEIIRRIASI